MFLFSQWKMFDFIPTLSASAVISLFNLEPKFSELQNILTEAVNANKLAVML